MQFGNNIKVLLKQKNIKQTKFAEMMETGNTTVSNWINGVSYPDFKTLLKIKEVLNVDLNDLIYEDLENSIKFKTTIKMNNSNSNANIEIENTTQVANSDKKTEMSLTARVEAIERKLERIENKIG